MISDPSPSPPVQHDWLSAETIATKLDISVRTLERWVASRQFPEPDIRRGPKIKRWTLATYQGWLQAQR